MPFTKNIPSYGKKLALFISTTIAASCSSMAFAAATGGFSTTDGGNVAGARSFSASTHTQMQQIINDAKSGNYPVIITYTGNEDSLINEVIRDHTADSSGNCPKARWNEEYRKVEIKELTQGVTIQGANGSSANFGIVINKSSNVIVRNMKIGALAGAKNDADMIRIDSGVNVWIDHNELFAVNNECKGSPDGDLTFESAIDIKKASQDITVSYNLIRDSKKVGLDGSSSSDIGDGRKITFHHNIYRNVNARLPLQRGGWTHMYNNLYDGVTGSGINVRQNGYALIESNWFQNAANPVTCRYDSSNCGKWDLRNNNVRNPGDFATYNITWTGGGTIDANNWTTTAPFPISIPYSYSPVTPQCVKDRLVSYAGVGKNGAVLTAATCGGATSSSSGNTSSGSSSSSANGSTGVTFYQHTEYGGYAVTLAVGDYTLSQLASRGVRNDDVSSIKVPSGWSVTLYEHDNYSGASLTKTSDDSTLVDDSWNDRISSVKITRGTTNPSSSQSSSAGSSGPTTGTPTLSGTGDYPSGFSKCADLGGTCAVESGDGWVAFGRKGKWVTKKVNVGSSIACTVSAFGSDPQGNPNKCSYKR